MDHKLPEYLKYGEAFKAGEMIVTQLAARCINPDKQLKQLLRDSQQTVSVRLIAAELVADSLGYSCWDGCWNIYVREYLFKSGYIASAETIHATVGAIQSLPIELVDSAWLMDIKHLIHRLRNKPRPVVRSNPILTKGEYKKIQQGFGNQDNEEFGIANSTVCGFAFSVEHALVASSMRAKAIKQISLHHSREPTRVGVEVYRILLHRFRENITQVSGSAWAEYRFSDDGLEITDASNLFWNNLRHEITALSELNWFESWKLGIDEETAMLVLQLPKLEVFRIWDHAPFMDERHVRVALGSRFIDEIINNSHIQQVDVPIMGSDHIQKLRKHRPDFDFTVGKGRLVDVPCLEANDQQRILAAMPDVILQIDGRRAYSGKQADEAAAQKQLEQQLAANANEPENQSQDTGRNDPFYPFDVSCSKEDGIETATVGFGVFSKYNWAIEIESLDDFCLNGYGIAGLLQTIIHDNQLSENVDSIDAEGSDVLVTLNGWKAAKRLGKVAAKALRDEKKLRQLIARTRELGFED